MKKKILIGVIVGAVLAAAIIIGAVLLLDENKNREKGELEFALNEDGESYSVVGLGTYSNTDVVIPDTYKGKPVTKIADRAFDAIPREVVGNVSLNDCAKITGIMIPDSVTSIGDDAFSACESLTKIEIPNSVTSIGNSAFSLCTSLRSIDIPNSVTNIGYSAFRFCGSLTNINVDTNNQNYKSIDGNLYSKDEKTLVHYAIGKKDTTFSIPKSVTNISADAFYGSESLKSITIPDSMTSINLNAFDGCPYLENLEIPDSVISFNVNISVEYLYFPSLEYNEYDNALYLGNKNNPYLVLIKVKDTSITNCDIHNRTRIVANLAFFGCESLRSLTIPNSVISIDHMAFGFSSRLEDVYYTGDVEDWLKIDFGGWLNPLKYASNLYFNNELVTNIVIPDSVTSIGDYAFEGCSSLTSIEISDSVESIGAMAFYDCTSLTSIEIPDSVTSIGVDAFRGCTSLTSIEIPGSVTSIGNGAFGNCASLTSIEVAQNNEYYKSENGNLYSKDGATLIQYAIGKKDTAFSIPDSVTSISDYAFYGCRSLTSIEIPNSVTSIDDYAFSYCTSLTSIEIPDSVTYIGSSAFKDCTSLTIYCEVESKPSGWISYWNPDNRPVVWGYTGE